MIIAHYSNCTISLNQPNLNCNSWCEQFFQWISVRNAHATTSLADHQFLQPLRYIASTRAFFFLIIIAIEAAVRTSEKVQRQFSWIQGTSNPAVKLYWVTFAVKSCDIKRLARIYCPFLITETQDIMLNILNSWARLSFWSLFRIA